MRRIISIAIFLFCLQLVQSQERYNGFFDFSWQEEKGSITLHLKKEQLDRDFLYVSSLAAGIGSNDIGLDRGQLGQERVVSFKRLGNKIMLMQKNMGYRAESDNYYEKRSVQEAFAQSAVFGFEIKESTDSTINIDITSFLLRDAHDVSKRLQSSNQGTYRVDASTSAVWMERCKSFPQNTEFEAQISFSGDAKGAWIRSVAPDADQITVRMHHSFIELPELGTYKPRKFHPYSGYFPLSYYDYATPIESPLEKRFIYRHRLEKKNPSARVSEAVEPIIYYLDPGCPEPIRSALIEGASWWDQAFQAAGYAPGTFQVKVLPEGADMLDVRYNVIQWVHRSTRGWSYGSSISDPRTGEILKGHVSLGSLRVRQDFLIAQGLLSPYGSDNSNNGEMKKLALARLRQLSAHEVGHTIGLAHNFASSVNNRASVMDYPHPLVQLAANGKIDFSQAYDTGIGEWDKRTIAYGYQDFPKGIDEEKALQAFVVDAQKQGYLFISDSDARAVGGANPQAHLWDNGGNASDELNRLLKIRKTALAGIGENSIPAGTPLSELEKLLVPVYLLHRYQTEAAVKLIGGLQYNYFVKGDAYDHTVKPVSRTEQEKAIMAILASLKPEELALPEHLLKIMPPSALGYERDRETFKSRTNLAFDIMAPAESYINETLSLLLNKDRLARLHRQTIIDHANLALDEYLEMLTTKFYTDPGRNNYHLSIQKLSQSGYINYLLRLSMDKSVDLMVAQAALGQVKRIESKYLSGNDDQNLLLKTRIAQALGNPSDWQFPEMNDLPPGSPIGCNGSL